MTLDRSALMALAHAFDREDAAQRGEPDPWPAEGEAPTADDVTWVEERIACAEAGMSAFLAASPSVVTEEMVEAAAKIIAGDDWNWPEPDGQAEIRGTTREIARNALTAALSAGGGWRPIETAPKDGAWIIALRPECNFGRWERVHVVRWSEDHNAFIWADHFDVFKDDMDERDERGHFVFDPFESNDFTHWMPLPAAPQEGSR